MTRFELDELQAVPEWRPVLAAYRRLQAEASRSVRAGQGAHAGASQGLSPSHPHSASHPGHAEFDGWLPRLSAVEGVEAERLPAVHGRLMALGFLRFQVGGRTVGLQYQLTREGREALNAADARGDAVWSAIGETENDSDPDAGEHPGRGA